MWHALIGVAVACGLFTAMFVFGFWWLMPVVLVGGGLIAAIIGYGASSVTPGRTGWLVAVAAYAATAFGLGGWVANQIERWTFRVEWRDAGTDPRSDQRNVALRFADYPGVEAGMYSTSLRDLLAASPSPSLMIEVEVMHTLGCVRRQHFTRIEGVADLTLLKRAGEYFGPQREPPWERFWWCRLQIG